MNTLMQKNLQGTIFGGGNPHYDIPQLLSMYKAGKLNIDDMITRQYKLEQINEGYQDMLDGKQHSRRDPLHGRRSVTRPLRVFQVASGNVGTEMVRRIQQSSGPGTGRAALLFTGEGRA